MKTKGFLSKLVLFNLALLLIASLLAVSCSSGTTSSPSTTTSTSATTTKPATTTTTPAVTTPAIKKGGTLKIIYGVSPNAPDLPPVVVPGLMLESPS